MRILILRDLVSGLPVRFGMLLVATTAGLVATVPATLFSTGISTGGLAGEALLSIGGTASLLTVVAVVVVARGAMVAAVDARRPLLARWLAIGVLPRGLALSVLVDAVVIGVLGATGGGLVGAAAAPTFVSWGLSGATGVGDVDPTLDPASVGLAVAAVVAALLVASIRGAREAARVTPRDRSRGRPAEPRRLPRIVGILVLAAGVAGLVASLADAVPSGLAPATPAGVLTVAVGVTAVPLVLGPLLTSAARILPGRSITWDLAAGTAASDIGRGSAAVGSLVVAIGLPAALVGAARTSGSAAGEDSPGMFSAAAALLLAGPVALAAIGALTTVLETTAQRRREQGLLGALGVPLRVSLAATAIGSVLLVAAAALCTAVPLALLALAEQLVLAPIAPSTTASAGTTTLLTLTVAVIPVFAGSSIAVAASSARRPLRGELAAE